MHTLPTLRDIGEVSGKRVLLRLDLNVPMQEGKILDETRIVKSLPTLRALREDRARTVIVSHLGDGSESLAEVARLISRHFPVGFIPTVNGPEAEEAIRTLPNGSALMLENLRRDPGETANSTLFALSLGRMGDVYVNDAFSASHRPHASIVSLPRLLPGYIGLQFEKELKELRKTLKPKHPFLFVLGGAKLETKLPLLRKFLSVADHVYVGGAILNSFFMGPLSGKEAEEVKLLRKNKKLVLPTDLLVNDGTVRRVNNLRTDDIIRDIGPASLERLLVLIAGSSEVLFNGPLGHYELGFDKTTVAVLRALAEGKARSVVGGGDTAALVARQKLEPKLSFVSTAGGAMIEFLSEGTLPGIEALTQRRTNNK